MALCDCPFFAEGVGGFLDGYDRWRTLDDMKKIIGIVAVVIIIAAGGTAAYIAMHDNRKASGTTGSSQSADSSMNDMDMQQGSQASSGTSSTDGTAQDGMDGGANASGGNTSNAASTDQVKIANYAFSPDKITIKVGTKVTWTNSDVVQHNVAMDDGADGPSSPMLGKGDTYTYTFAKAGTYNYHCTPHPYMKGMVVVTE